MSQPQLETRHYKIIEKVSISVRHDVVTVLIKDGATVRRAEEKAPKNANLNNLSQPVLARLWQGGQEVSMKQWRTSSQREQEGIINDAVDAILRVLGEVATPTFSDIVPPAKNVLEQSGKLDDWQKLNTLLQQMTEVELRQFLAFIILITLSKSAGD